ncbi:MAG: energy-coupling factor transporter transmembrane protein EcfT, partial [Mycobacterium sp.]
MTLPETDAETDAETDTVAAGRVPRPVVLLRPVPGTSAVHRLWAGTKLIVVFGISVLLTFYPGWVPIGAVALLVL